MPFSGRFGGGSHFFLENLYPYRYINARTCMGIKRNSSYAGPIGKIAGMGRDKAESRTVVRFRISSVDEHAWHGTFAL